MAIKSHETHHAAATAVTRLNEQKEMVHQERSLPATYLFSPSLSSLSKSTKKRIIIKEFGVSQLSSSSLLLDIECL